MRDYGFWLKLNQLSSECRKALVFPIRETPLDDQILSFDVPENMHSLYERVVVGIRI